MLRAAGIIISIGLGVCIYLGLSHTRDSPPIVITDIDEAVVMRTNGGLLEVSSVTATEVFSKSTQQHIPLLNIPFGQTYSTICK